MSAAFPSPPPGHTVLRGLGAGVAVLAGAGALGACSSREATPDNPAAGDDAGNGFTITDQRGKKVSFDGPVERIATAIIPSPSMLAAVDASYDRIVGINEPTLTANKQGPARPVPARRRSRGSPRRPREGR
uniref:Uncharacterized protein n=1 Tax=Streptomyces sp. NBC_00008 TaxID=2903610 RepID=A0AAU2VHP4_9ACTN